MKEYRANHKDKLNKYWREYKKTQYHTNPLIKERQIIQMSINKILKFQTKKIKYIDLSIPEIVNHFENQFNTEMTWDNYGSVWEIEHIKPISECKDLDELRNSFHYTNLKPILKTQNKTGRAKR